MKCEKVKSRLNDYITGNLKSSERGAIENHLSDCPVCTEELAFVKEIESLFSEMDFAEPPPELWNNIKRQIEKKKKPDIREYLSSLFLFPADVRKTFAAVFAVILIITGAGIFLWRGEVTVQEYLYPSDYVAEHILASYDDPLSDKVALNLIIAGEDSSE